MGIKNIGLQTLTLVTTDGLARVLKPADFGLVAIVTVVVGLFSLVNRAGWGAALVVRDELTEGDVALLLGFLSFSVSNRRSCCPERRGGAMASG